MKNFRQMKKVVTAVFFAGMVGAAGAGRHMRQVIYLDAIPVKKGNL